jgi:DNA-binding XRE family transcriptional regulator
MEKKIIDTINELLTHNITRTEAVSRLLSLYNVMPSLLSMKERRGKLKLSLRYVAKQTNVSPATISRIERGNECDFGNVKALDDWYSSNGS